MMRFAALGAAGLMLLGAGAAFAQATVTPLGGIVLVNHGSGFVNLAKRTVQRGDRLMARPGGRADLTYSNGCVNRVAPGAVVVVGTPASCLAESRAAAAGTTGAAKATGVAGASADAASAGVAVVAGGLGIGGTILVVGVLAGGLVAGVMATSSGTSGSESPLSP